MRFQKGFYPCLHSKASWGRPRNDVKKFVIIDAVAPRVVRAEHNVNLRMISFWSGTPHCHEHEQQHTGGAGVGKHILDSSIGRAPLHRLGSCDRFVS